MDVGCNPHTFEPTATAVVSFNPESFYHLNVAFGEEAFAVIGKAFVDAYKAHKQQVGESGKMKRYEIKIVIEEGNDEFWVGIGENTGADEVLAVVREALAPFDAKVKLTKFEDKE